MSLDLVGRPQPVINNQRTSIPVNAPMLQAVGVPTELTVEAVVDDRTVTVADVTGFVAGLIVVLITPTSEFYFARQLGAPAGNVISLDTPIDKVFVIGSTVVKGSSQMNVDGSVTPQIFTFGPFPLTVGIDVVRFTGYIQDGTAMDDAKFGGIPALINGMVLRKTDGISQNLWNAKSNNELAVLAGGDFNYTDKAPAGSFGARFRVTYGGNDKHGTVIRVVNSDFLQIIIQDDLTDLEAFYMNVQGHKVQP